MRVFGLIGKNISYSYSKFFFNQKFKKENIKDAIYKIFDIKDINQIKMIFNENKNLYGLNITIPYKEKIFHYINEFSPEVLKIGSINTIKIMGNKIIGYNTDIYGFETSFLKMKKKNHTKALILGTGGAAKAISYILKKQNIIYKYVSRYNYNNITILYSDITKSLLNDYNIIINCTPIGTYPNIHECPNIPYNYLTKNHYMYDLIYNPYETLFLNKGRQQGCLTKNGLDMLYLQANKSWEIWNS